eukprot:gene35657-43246_t
MSSGLGIRGNTSRCFEFFQDFSACMKTASDNGSCRLLRDDYLECLHGTKQVERVKIIAEQDKINKEGGGAKGGHGGGGHH